MWILWMTSIFVHRSRFILTSDFDEISRMGRDPVVDNCEKNEEKRPGRRIAGPCAERGRLEAAVLLGDVVHRALLGEADLVLQRVRRRGVGGGVLDLALVAGGVL